MYKVVLPVVLLSFIVSSFQIETVVESMYCSSFAPAQNCEGLIDWTEDLELEWECYRGVPDEASAFEAITSSEIKSSPISYNYDSIVVRITNRFNPEKSWSRDKNSSLLLSHERLHFDISEVVTRKLRQAYGKTKITDLKLTYAELSRLFKYYGSTVLDSLNFQYDEETLHGTIASKQKDWELKISNELKSLSEFSSPIVVVRKR